METVNSEAVNSVVEKKVVTLKSLEADFASLLQMHNTLVASHNELLAEVEALKSKPAASVRSRGPESTKVMSEEDARSCMIGEFAKLSHREAAEKLGLSYGQVYSARGGYTFKPIYAEMIKIQKAQN